MDSNGEENIETGRAAVRDLVVNRLREAGIKPRKGMTEAAHARAMDHLVDYLSHMSRANLQTLAESLIDHVAKSGSAVWPAEVLVRSWAEALQPRPFQQHPIIASWLRSVEGPVADAGGYLVDLLRWLRRHRRPLTKGDLAQVKRDAEDLQASLARIRERIDGNVPWPDDHAKLAAYLRDLAEARQYVDAGHERRAAIAAQGCAA